MATGDTLVRVEAQNFFPENGNNPTGGEFGLRSVGLIKGLSFHAGNTAGAVAVVRLPKTASLATGLTFKLLWNEDATDTPASGGNVVWGVNIALLGSGSSYYVADTTNLGTEATSTTGCPVTTNVNKTGERSIAIVQANCGGAAADTYCLVRIRRLGASSTDTCKSAVNLFAVTVLDT